MNKQRLIILSFVLIAILLAVIVFLALRGLQQSSSDTGGSTSSSSSSLRSDCPATPPTIIDCIPGFKLTTELEDGCPVQKCIADPNYTGSPLLPEGEVLPDSSN